MTRKCILLFVLLQESLMSRKCILLFVLQELLIIWPESVFCCLFLL